MTTSTRIKILMIAIILIVIAGVIFLILSPTSPKIVLPTAVSIDTSNQPVSGNPNAKIHIVAFEDLKCANCMRYNKTIFPNIDTNYIKTGKANYTMVNLAFIQGSLPAANAARCVYAQNHDAFFDYVNYIYAHQPPEDQDWATIPNLMLFATHTPGINSDALAHCLVAMPYVQFFMDNLSLATKVMGSNVSTPAIYINGIKVDPLTWAHVQQIIDQVNS